MDPSMHPEVIKAAKAAELQDEVDKGLVIDLYHLQEKMFNGMPSIILFA